MKKILILALVLATSLAGWRFAAQRLEDQQRVIASSEAARQEWSRRLRAEKTELQSELRDLAGRLASDPAEPALAAPAAPTPSFRPVSAQLAKMIADGKVKLTPGGSSGIDPLVPTASGAFPVKFGKLFDLSNDRVTKLQDDMIAIKERVDALIAERSTVKRQEDGSVVIACAPLSEGEGLRREFRELLLGAIGPDGLATYLILRPEYGKTGSGGIDDFFNAFGINGAITTIKQQPNGLYEFKRVGSPEGRTTGFTTSSANNTPRSRLLTYLGPQAALLPTDF